MSTNTRRFPLESQVFKLEVGVFLDVCESVNTARSLTCYLLAKNSEWDQYLELGFPDPLSSTFADDYLVTEMMSKNPRLPIARDRSKLAIEKFLDAERLCKETNVRLRRYGKGEFLPPADVERTITRAVRIIATVLGDLNVTKLNYASDHMRFGPGATSAVSGREVVLSRKITSRRLDVTPRLRPYAETFLGFPWNERADKICLRGYSKITTVPKNAKIDRVIAIEPHLNIYCQLGIGALIRRQLLRSGLDLNTQQRNQIAARDAFTANLATVDLSSASDTISSELVWLMLPVDWAALLDVCRTEYTVVNGVETRLEKFSSMGNGYTFELESLIFWAVARACGDDDAIAYGDDIVINRSCAPLLIDTLEFLGFKVNTKKTFMAGCFFESCGTDWWRGIDVRPFYLRGTYNDYTSAVIRIANAIRIYSHRRNRSYGCDIRFLRAWLRCISRDSTARSTGIPINSGNDGLIRNFDECAPSKAKHGIEGFFATVWRGRPVQSKLTNSFGAYVAALIWGSAESSRLVEYERGRMHAATLKRQLISDWRDLGPWF